MTDETACKYVGSRGLLKSCVIKSATPMSSVRHVINQDFKSLNDADTIYICSSALADFVNNYLDKITTRFILLSGDSDVPIPNGALTPLAFEKLYNCDRLIAWFSQNLAFSPKEYPKLRHLPIGLDYHTLSEKPLYWGPMTTPKMQEDLLMAVASKARPFYERKPIAYTTFHFVLERGGRQKAYDEIPRDLVHYEPERVARLISWREQAKYAFVVSPPGEGFDCHRTWEAICLGCIPIMISTPLDDMFEGLPVLIVKSWSDVTKDLLDRTIDEYKTREFCMERITLNYWLEQINACK